MSETRGHPRILYWLCLTEMWERFSYYGMRGLLVFYLTQTFLFGDDTAYDIYGAYTALVYLAPLFGGMLADRVLGNRKAIVIGATLMALGHFAMAFQSLDVFYGALALLIIGNGFFKPNMSTIIGRLYPEGDPRRDAGYTIFYMGVNAGAVLAGLVPGWVGGKFGWHWGFTLAGIGMVFGLAVFLVTQHKLEGRGDPPDPQMLRRRVGPLSVEAWIPVAAAVAVAGVWWLIQYPSLVTGGLKWIFLITVVGILLYSFRGLESVPRHRVWAALILTVFSVVFWAFFEQAGSSLNLFTGRNVNTTVMGAQLPAPVMQSINPLFIILLGAPFAWMWSALGRAHRNPTIPAKFALGIIQLGLGYAALYYGAFTSQESGIVPLVWLVLGYLLHTTGELCISPVGLSMISKLAPAHMTSFMMGTWYLSISTANALASTIAKLTGVSGEGVPTAELPPAETVMAYGDLFGQLAIVAGVTGLIVFALSPLIHRATHGVR